MYIHDGTDISDCVHPNFSRGLIPRNYDTHPSGCFAGAPTFPDELLIPETEWQKRLDEQIANKASLYDLRVLYYDVLKSLDQNGKGLCHTGDTEVLTEKGWKAWPEYNYSDLLATVNPSTHFMEFQAPFEKHIYEYKGEMVHSSNRRIDFGVTPDHRMLVRKWDSDRKTLSNRYTFQRAGSLGWYAGLMHAPAGFIGTELERVAILGDRSYNGNDFLAMISVIVSDGYVTESEGHTGQVGFCCFNESRYPMVAALAHRIGFKEVPSRKGVWTRYSAHALAAWLKKNCYVGNTYKAQYKIIPNLVKCASSRQITYFLKWYGDQNHAGEQNCYYSSSKRIIDDLQELLLRVGKRSTICSKPGKSVYFDLPGKTPYWSECKELFTLVVGKVDRLCIDKKKHIETDRYNGLVYCAAVPNGTLITRRNGSVLISGNCWAFSTTKSVMYLRAIMNAPMERLSAYWVAGQVKGWSDQGGWNLESLQEIVSAGVPLDSLCPSYSSKYNTAEAKADAATRKVTEWWEGSQDRDRNRRIMISAFLMGLAPPLDFNWLSHSMCGCRLVSLSPLTIDCDNSWGEISQYGEKGLYRISGNRAIPDSISVPRVTSPS